MTKMNEDESDLLDLTNVPAAASAPAVKELDTPSNDAKIQSIGIAILNRRCLPVFTPDGGKLLYQVTSWERREVRCVAANEDVFQRAVSKIYPKLPDGLKLSQHDKRGRESVVDTLSVKRVKEVVAMYLIDQAKTLTIKPFAWKGDDAFTLKRLDFDLAEGTTPAWDEFLARLSDQEAFLAFVWSIFEEKHRGRQGLWLKGLDGQDGKSSVLNLLGELVGEAHGTLTGGREERFAHSQYHEKRLLLFPDCTTPSFVRTQLYRNYTGGDVVSVEYKGLPAFSKKVYARVMIGSNFTPQIEDEGASRSRLLIVEVGTTTKEARKDATWIPRMRQEFPSLLWRARAAYQRLCPDDYVIEVSNVEQQEDLVDEATSSAEGRWEALLKRHFMLSEGATISRMDFHNALSSERLTSFDVHSFKRFLQRHGVKERRFRDRTKRQRGFEGLALLDGFEGVSGPRP